MICQILPAPDGSVAGLELFVQTAPVLFVLRSYVTYTVLLGFDAGFSPGMTAINFGCMQ